MSTLTVGKGFTEACKSTVVGSFSDSRAVVARFAVFQLPTRLLTALFVLLHQGRRTHLLLVLSHTGLFLRPSATSLAEVTPRLEVLFA